MWDLIVSVPDHCLSFYFARYTSQGNRSIIALFLKRGANICKRLFPWDFTNVN